MKRIYRLIHCAVILSLCACASTTTIQIDDPQVRVYLDGEFRGGGKIIETNTKIVGSSTMVTLRKEGCAPVNFYLNRNEELDVGALIAGIFVVPLLWVMKYKPVHAYTFECQKI